MRRVLLTFAAFACAKSERPPADTVVATPAAAATPNVVNIAAQDFAYTAPDTISAGLTTFRLTSTGQAPHHVQIVRLDSGKTHADFTAALKSMTPTSGFPSWVRLVPGPQVPDVGKETNVTTMLQPGPHVLICVVDIPDKVPHFAKGMVKPLTVVPASAPPAAPPTADVAVIMKDYTWSIEPPLTAGKHTIKLENAGPQPHEMVIVRVAEGKTPDDVGKWAATFSGPPPFAFVGGTSMMDVGATAYLDVDLVPGMYMLFCFYPDAKDGKLHADHGMVMPLDVK